MQFHRVKDGGYIEMKVLLGFCTTAALALLVFMSVNSVDGPCEKYRIQKLHLEQLYPYGTGTTTFTPVVREILRNCSMETHEAEEGAKDEDICYREWEMPSVTSERDWEKLWDENTREQQRTFTPVGVSAFLFIEFGAYRGGPNNFSVVGLAPKALHLYGNPGFECYWIPADEGETVTGNATKILPGIKDANQYTTTVIHCSFENDVGTDGAGGSLRFVADMGSQDATGLSSVHFVALTESAGEYDSSLFKLPLKYDYMYCGSPLSGDINPLRVREWIAYHAKMFGPRAHFILYDAGGADERVRKVLAPWVKLGTVSIMDYRQEARYDVHFHSQVLVVNDCLLQAKRLAEWAFFFDLDEYLYVPRELSLDQVMRDLANKGRRAQQVTLDQRPMSPDHCVPKASDDSDDKYRRQWAIEKLMFQRTQITEWGGWKEHKYAIQTRYILATGTHDHESALVPDGMDPRQTITYVGCGECGEDNLHYHHYHKIFSLQDDFCKEFVDPPWYKEMKFENVTHIYDNSVSSLAKAVKQFELKTIGPQPY